MDKFEFVMVVAIFSGISFAVGVLIGGSLG